MKYAAGIGIRADVLDHRDPQDRGALEISYGSAARRKRTQLEEVNHMHADIELQAMRFNIEREWELKRIERNARLVDAHASIATSASRSARTRR